MPAMKVTISAAMRARDVSRPRPEDLAEAEAGEASWEGHPWAGGSDEEGDHPERAALAGAWAAVAEEAGLVWRSGGIPRIRGTAPGSWTGRRGGTGTALPRAAAPEGLRWRRRLGVAEDLPAEASGCRLRRRPHMRMHETPVPVGGTPVPARGLGSYWSYWVTVMYWRNPGQSKVGSRVRVRLSS